MAIKTAILGFAHGHVQSYCDEWKKDPELGVAVTAGWDHDEKRLSQTAEKFGFQPYSSLDQLLALSDLEAVVIGAETSMHADLVERAAAAGKNIILQKPISLTMGEADRIVEAVSRHGVQFSMAWQMRVDPQNLKIKELLESGEFGQVFMLRRRHGLPMGLNPEFADSWHVDPKLNRDIWADDSSHPIDFIYWLLGQPETITAEIVSLYNPRIPMDNGVALFRYADGPLAEVSCSFTCNAAENTVEVICEKGTILLSYGDSPSCNVSRPEGAEGLKWYLKEEGRWTHSHIPTPEQHHFRIRGLAKPLAEFLLGKREAIATAEAGREALRMTLATYVSAREGRRVSYQDEKIAFV
ncbi:MAG: gfo/Idh/MocA family oxidoreductase [Paenibacillus sp.]|jgi:predicted dehydrogenase|nr:gfo/Idh/MocA family oxidoreductase [Paenibacillus sp.]